MPKIAYKSTMTANDITRYGEAGLLMVEPKDMPSLIAALAGEFDDKAAREQAREEGYADGHDDGYDAGHAMGYSVGREEGSRGGYEAGYDEGVADAKAGDAGVEEDETN